MCKNQLFAAMFWMTALTREWSTPLQPLTNPEALQQMWLFRNPVRTQLGFVREYVA